MPRKKTKPTSATATGARYSVLAGRPSKQSVVAAFGKTGYGAVPGLPEPTAWHHPRGVVRAVQDGLGRRQGRVGSLVGEEVNRFNPGQVVATPGALAALEASGESLLVYLQRTTIRRLGTRG